MSLYAKLPSSESDTDALEQQVKDWLLRLGFQWQQGMGGVFRYHPPGRPPCWRVYSEWAGMGATVDIDAQTGEVLEISEAPFETIVARPRMPEKLIPREVDVIDFVRSRLSSIGWLLPADITSQWDADSHTWHLAASSPGSNRVIQVAITGRAGNLRFSCIAVSCTVDLFV